MCQIGPIYTDMKYTQIASESRIREVLIDDKIGRWKDQTPNVDTRTIEDNPWRPCTRLEARKKRSASISWLDDRGGRPV